VAHVVEQARANSNCAPPPGGGGHSNWVKELKHKFLKNNRRGDK